MPAARLLLIAALVALLAACGSPSGNGGRATATPTPAAEDGDGGDDDGGDVTIDENASLQELMPDEVAGVQLEAAFGEADATLGEAYVAMIERLGANPEDAEFASAADPNGELALFIIALRVPGADTDRLREEYLATAAEDEGVEFSEETVAGKEVAVAETESGTNYVYVRGDVIFVVLADERALAEEALAALP